MKCARIIFALPALAAALCAQTAPQAPQLPDRPALAITQYNGAWLPIIGADGYDPVVISNGAPVTVKGRASVMLTPGDRYSDGFVTIAEVSATDVPVTTDPEIADNMPSIMDTTSEVMRATIACDTDVQGAYAILVSCSIDADPDAPPTLAVVPDKLGQIKAGVPMSFSIVLPKPKSGSSPGWSILVFCEGRQLRSTGMGKVLPAYFDRIEHIALKKRIEERVEKGVDAPVSAFRELPLALPDALRAKYHGKSLRVEMQVGIAGAVESVHSVSAVDPAMSEALSAQFSNWLFIPALRDHVLVPANVIIPLRM